MKNVIRTGPPSQHLILLRRDIRYCVINGHLLTLINIINTISPTMKNLILWFLLIGLSSCTYDYIHDDYRDVVCGEYTGIKVESALYMEADTIVLYALSLEKSEEDSIVDLVYQVLVDDSIYTSLTYSFYFTGEVFQYPGYDPEWKPSLEFTNPDLHFHLQPGLGPFYIDLYATKIE